MAQPDHEPTSRGLAVQVAAIARDVAAVTKSVENVAHLVEGLSQRIETVSHRAESTASRVGRPDWQAWAFCGTIILGLVGLFGSGYVRDLTRLEQGQQETVHAQSQAALAAEFQRGQGTAKDDELQRRIEKLDETLQREMRLAIATTEEGLSGLEKRVSGELFRETERLRTRVDVIADELRVAGAERSRLAAIVDLTHRVAPVAASTEP